MRITDKAMNKEIIIEEMSLSLDNEEDVGPCLTWRMEFEDRTISHD